jgi:NAD(P)-dependent dehydrogenase (short-subunit alcohol dehydrogenase family)
LVTGADVQRMELRPFGIDVVLVRPTGVATPFMDKIAATYPGTGPDSAHADQLEAHRKPVAALGQREPGFLVITPQRVGEVIADEATRRRPHTRIKVGASARVFAFTRRHVSDRVWDRMATNAL